MKQRKRKSASSPSATLTTGPARADARLATLTARARPAKVDRLPPRELPTGPAPPSPYLTAEEAGKYLRLFNTAHAMQQATKRYGIPHIRVGKKILYCASQLDEFLTVATEATSAVRRR